MVRFSSVGKDSDDTPGLPTQACHEELQIKAAKMVSRAFVRRAKLKRVKIAAGNPNRRMAEVAVRPLSKTCPKRVKLTLIIRLQKKH